MSINIHKVDGGYIVQWEVIGDPPMATTTSYKQKIFTDVDELIAFVKEKLAQ